MLCVALGPRLMLSSSDFFRQATSSSVRLGIKARKRRVFVVAELFLVSKADGIS